MFFVFKLVLLRKFRHNSVLGTNFSVLKTARCHNFTLDRNRILIGNNVELGAKLIVVGDGKISIGHNTTIRYNSVLLSTIGIYIGNNVIISSDVVIYDNNTHPISPAKRLEMTSNGFYGKLWSNVQAEKKEVYIEDNVWVCQRVMIMKGVRVCKGSVIAAGAVVTKDVPPYSVVAGNPAKVVKSLLIE